MFKQQASKPFEFVGTARTFNRFTLEKDHFLHYSYRASFCLLLQTHVVLQRKSSVSIQALSGRNQDPASAQPSKQGYFLLAINSTVTPHTTFEHLHQTYAVRKMSVQS